MAIETDFSVATNGDIRHVAGTTNYTVLELHRWLQDLADDASAIADDFVDITSDTPSDRSTDNIINLLGAYNIDATAAEFLYGGSVSQASGAELYSGLQVLGAVNNTNTLLQVVQNNTLYDGAAPFWGDQSTGGYNGDAASGVLMRCLVLSRTGGSDIDGKRIRVQSRNWGDSYDFFNVTLGQGESVAAISTTPDAQNDTTQGTVTAYTHVTNVEGFQLIDLNNGNGNREYYSQWTYGADTSADGLKGAWEFTKDLTGTGTAKTIHGINGELFLGITHSWAYDNELVAQFQEDEILSWGTGATAGTGLLLALDDDGTTGNMYIQLLTGVIPSDNDLITGGTSTATCDVQGAVVAKTVPKHFIGSYTGSLIGAYGIGFLPADLIAADKLQDLSGTDQQPPNNVTFTVSSLEIGEDRVLVGPRLAGVLDEAQLGLNATQTGAAVTSLVMDSVIPTDTPSAGTIRVLNDIGIYVRIVYSSYTGSTFTITSTDFSTNNATAGNNVFVSYIDILATATSETFTSVFLASRDLFVRVRDGDTTPIKTFESPATLGSGGGSISAIRTSDA